MIKFDNKIAIFGSGGFGKETMCYLMDYISGSNYKIEDLAVFVVDDNYYSQKTILNIPVVPYSEFSYQNYEVIVAVGESSDRKNIIERLPADTRFLTLIHPRAFVSKLTEIAEGSIVAPGAVVSCDIKIGKHAHINYNATIGHDCNIGDFFTASPGCNIGGNCIIGSNVYVGANSSIREKLTVTANVKLGMGAVVVKHITEPGVYIGSPAMRMVRK